MNCIISYWKLLGIGRIRQSFHGGIVVKGYPALS